MLINVIGISSSSQNNANNLDKSVFVQKPKLRTKYKEKNIEEDIDMTTQNILKNLKDPISNREAASNNYVDNKSTIPVL